MNAFRIFFAVGFVSGGLVTAATTDGRGGEDLTLWYEKPAAKGMNEALPIGNGKFGALVYSAVGQERLVLNEISLWTGDEHANGDYAQMGSYQMLGELLVDLEHGASGDVAAATVVCASEHKAFYPHEELEYSYDGNSGTKWCVEHKGKPVIWELRLPRAQAVDGYSFTSGPDTPARDPSTWEFKGSNDGKEWIVLDRHEGEPPFQKRGETKKYALKKADEFRFYRLIFEPNKGVPHFQIGEIAVGGVQIAATQSVPAQDYRRALNIATATHELSYKSGETAYRREAFASHADHVLVFRFTADRKGAHSGSIRLQGTHGETTQAEKNHLQFSGKFPNGLTYETGMLVLSEGGSVQARDGKLEFKECNSLTLILAAATNYVLDYSKKYHDGDPHAMVEQRLNAAAKKTFDELKSAHIADHRALFDRVKLDLGSTPAERKALPIDKRKVVHAEKGGDPEIEALMFQYGRYLMISCSRPGGLPANLQGLWNDSNDPPWHCDYHANINIQMNYWLAEPAGLPECHETLFELIVSQLEPWRVATAGEKSFKTNSGKAHGWTVRTSHGIHGDMGWQWDVTANAWYCQHFWWHYVYGQDKDWLKKMAYPLLKETCEFWEDRVKALPDGQLVIPNGWSPEHGPHEDGVAYCQQIVWDLFNNYVQASEALDVDGEYRAKISAMRDKLVGPKIGKWGQLQEWMVDRDDPNDHHRHTSHLFAVFPGNQISVAKTPEFAAAAKKSLDARGPTGDVREWSFAWRTALYARMHDGESAHAMFQNLLSNRNTCLNLFGLHPPMQMDGNFGITAGVCEMLVQSHEGEINLLPAIPAVWSSGSVSGLRARGGFTVDVAWKDGKVMSYRVSATDARPVKVRINGELKTITAEKR